MSAPISKRDIQVFLGMTGYYRHFISNFSKIAELLFNLLKGKNKFIWMEDCQQAFSELKNFFND